MHRTRVAWLFAVVLLAAAGTACRGHRLAAGEGRLTVDGEAQVAAKGKAFKKVGHASTIRPGDRVRIDRGVAQIALAGGGKLELRVGSSLRFDATPFLEEGDLLATPGRRVLAIATEGADVNVNDGAARLSRTLALTLTAYRGTATIASAGSAPLSVKAPRQATLPARGVLPDRADPVDYRATDDWDRRFLADPYTIGERLRTQASGLMQQIPLGTAKRPEFWATLLPDLMKQPEGAGLPVPTEKTDEKLVGASIALRSRQGTFAERWKAVFDFRDPDGREVNWGFVAIDQGLGDPAPLADDLRGATERGLKAYAPETFAASFVSDGSSLTLAGGDGTSGSGLSNLPGGAADGSGGAGSGGSNTPGSSPGGSGGGDDGGGGSGGGDSPLPTLPPGVLPTLPGPTPTVPPGTPGTTRPPATGTPLDPIIDPLADSVSSLLQPPPPTAPRTTLPAQTVPRTTPTVTVPHVLP